MSKRLPPFVFLAAVLSTLAVAGRPSRPLAGTFPFTIQAIIDTSNTSAVIVSLGSQPGATDLLNSFSFGFDVKSANLPGGMNYARRQGNVSLTLGSNFVAGSPMYGQYVVLDKSGNTLFTKKFTYK